MPSSDSELAPNDGFTEGGDLILRSSDDVDFNVHSILLSLASPVFSDMLTVGTGGSAGNDKKNVITLGETAEMVALMLKLIYPLTPPTISSFEQLNQGLHVADKYQLKNMKSHLHERLLVHGSPVSVQADPLRALAVASGHGLQDVADIAVSHALKRYAFQQPDQLIELARVIPSAVPAIRLIVPQSIQAITLAEVLFSFHKYPMNLNNGNCQWRCGFCINSGPGGYSPPEWQARWAHIVYNELKGRSVQEWGPFFKYEFYNTAMYRAGKFPIPSGSQGHCACPEILKRDGYPPLFEKWATTVYEHLKERLQSLDKLEELKIL